jgi:hypothetical protein
MNARTQITIDPDTQRRAHARAAELGISFAEYVRRLLMQDLGESKRAGDISAVFNLVSEGPRTNVARDKDEMIAEAVWHEQRRSAGKRRDRRVRSKKNRR